ncbi:nucleoside-diphosphate kinase [Chytriomyces confervae]|uniref:Nucleoside diphosphate kinase n=1 Tax=Chytriomyces confervae TaxID=246404 RepID=A0A507EVQ3_9FUNG|nr:nucleoside-diphosphate kinase [Chytriomyces confervae]
MSNTAVPTVYLWIIDDVVSKMSPYFQSLGIPDQTLRDIEQKWTDRLVSSRCAAFGNVQSTQHAHTQQAPISMGMNMGMGMGPLAVGAMGMGLPLPNSQPQTQPQSNAQFYPPQYDNQPQQQQQEYWNQPQQQQQQYASLPNPLIQQQQQQQNQSQNQNQYGMPQNGAYGDFGSVPPTNSANPLVFGAQNNGGIQLLPPLQQQQQGYQQQHQQPAYYLPQNDGPMDDTELLAPSPALGSTASPSNGIPSRHEIDSLLVTGVEAALKRVRRRKELAAKQKSLLSQSSVPVGDGVQVTDSKEKRRALDSLVNNGLAKIISQVDGPDDDDDEDDDDDGGNDNIGSDLDSNDDDDDSDPELNDMILCQYEKVNRTKNKWKCVFKDGIVHVNGKDYLFHKASADFECLDPLLARQKETLSSLQTQLEATKAPSAAAAAENQSPNLSIESLFAASDSITAFAERYSRTLSGATSDADPPLHQRLFHPLLQGKEPIVTTPHLDAAVVSAHESMLRFQQAIDDFRSVKRSAASLSEIPPTSESATLARLHQIKSETEQEPSHARFGIVFESRNIEEQWSLVPKSAKSAKYTPEPVLRDSDNFLQMYQQRTAAPAKKAIDPSRNARNPADPCSYFASRRGCRILRRKRMATSSDRILTGTSARLCGFVAHMAEADDLADWQETVLLIRPEARQKENHILHSLTVDGFKILERKHIEVTAEQAEAYFQAANAGQADYDVMQEYVKNLTQSGSSVVFLLTRFGAYDGISSLMGPQNLDEARESAPTSLRARFAIDATFCGVEATCDAKATESVIKVFFPDRMRTVLPSVEESKLLLEDSLYPVLTQGLTMLCKTKPANPTVWLGTWLIENNPNRPKVSEAESR